MTGLIYFSQFLDINVKNYFKQTPLIMAAKLELQEEVIFLLKKKALIDEWDEAGKTALHYAVENSNNAIIMQLLFMGANYYL